jgi:chemotaxis protein histidine kinase CheA
MQSTLGIEYPSPAALSALQAKQQQLEQHKHNVESELLALQTELRETREALKCAEKARAEAAAQLQNIQQQLQQSDLAARLACTERDGLKKLVDLFEQEQHGDALKAFKAAEEAAEDPASGAADVNPTMAAVVAVAKAEAAASAAKVDSLQELVQQLRAAQTQLEQQLQAAVAAEASAKVAQATAAAEQKALTQECDDLSLKVSALEVCVCGWVYSVLCLHSVAKQLETSITNMLQTFHGQRKHICVCNSTPLVTWPVAVLACVTWRLAALYTCPTVCVMVQSQLAGGDYDPSTTRVLHLAANPAAEVERLRQQVQLDKLETENNELREALKRRGLAADQPAPGERFFSLPRGVGQPLVGFGFLGIQVSKRIQS